MQKAITLLLLMFIVGSVKAQDTLEVADTASIINDNPQGSNFLPLIYADRKLSYFTVTEGLGNLDPILTEARFSGSYFIKKSAVNWALELNLNLTLRMLNKYSFPINTPSYNPEITYYRYFPAWKNTFFSKLFYDEAYWEISAGHHSNGQGESFYVQDSAGNDTNQINLKNGSFSVEYLEAGFSTFTSRNKNGMNYITNLKLLFRAYPSKWYSPELEGEYGFYRLYGTFNIYRLPIGKPQEDSFFARSRLRVHAGWIMGDMGGIAPTDVSKRFINECTYFYYPKWLAEMSFFVRYYHGQDYYNIHFKKTLDVFQIGIASNPINFKDFAKFVKK